MYSGTLPYKILLKSAKTLPKDLSELQNPKSCASFSKSFKQITKSS